MSVSVYLYFLKTIKSDFRNFSKATFHMYLDLLRDLIVSKLLDKPDFFSEKLYWLNRFQAGNLSMKKLDDCTVSIGEQSVLVAIEELKLHNRFVSVLDVGCGPVSILAKEKSGAEDCEGTECLGVDPLSSFYKKLHEIYHTGYTLKCVEGTGENLTKYFGKERFELVVSENAIDHSINPRLIIENMFAILKPKGLLILGGFIKVGSKEGWTGLHKWNIEVVGSDLLLSNKDRSLNKKSLTAGLNLSLLSVRLYNDCYFFTFIKS